MTRARARAIHDEVNSLLTTFDFNTPLDGLLLHSDTLCVIRYIEQGARHGSHAIGEEDDEGDKEKKKAEANRRKNRRAGPGADPSGAQPGPPVQ